jgi:hypothetical protein
MKQFAATAIIAKGNPVARFASIENQVTLAPNLPEALVAWLFFLPDRRRPGQVISCSGSGTRCWAC